MIAPAPRDEHGEPWLCRCTCGHEQVVHTKKLLRLKFCDACRPSRRHDLTGKTFNNLTVIALDETSRKTVHWLCLCSCGNEKSVSATALTTGNTKSCGCLLRKQNRKQKEDYLSNRRDVLLRSKISSYKTNAKQRGYDWLLTDQEAFHLMTLDCFYCKTPPSNIASHDKIDQFIFYSGIDRVVNDIGYESTNVVPCCRDCNMAKGSKDMHSFLVWAHRVARNTLEPVFDTNKEVSDHDATRHPALTDVLSLYGDERGRLPTNLTDV